MISGKSLAFVSGGQLFDKFVFRADALQMLTHKLTLYVTVCLLIAGCAMKPPVQEMAEARSAIQTAQHLDGENGKAKLRLQSAENTLQDAADALDKKQYERARRKAVEAKLKAQQAARMKQSVSD